MTSKTTPLSGKMAKSYEEQNAWVCDTIAKATPFWAHLIAIAAQYKGLRWLHKFPIPLVKKFTDVSVKRETAMENPGKGFRPGAVRALEKVKIFKRGKLIAERTFDLGIITNSPFSRLV